MSDARQRQMERLTSALDEQPEENWLHPWMYSFMYAPVKSGGSWNGNGHEEIYLVGFCKNCRKGFTTLLDRAHGPGTMLTQTDVPRFGCVPPP